MLLSVADTLIFIERPKVITGRREIFCQRYISVSVYFGVALLGDEHPHRIPPSVCHWLLCHFVYANVSGGNEIEPLLAQF